jgi:hypothetical protein
MMRKRFLAAALPILACTVAGRIWAETVVDQVPRDALGFAFVGHLGETDAKLTKATGALRLLLPAPLTIVQRATGIGPGVDLDRDLLVALLPASDSSRPFHLAMWLPVKDYDALVRSLDGDPQRHIAAATIAGEDVLIAHVNDWAVVMDPNQRDRLEQLAETVASPAAQNAGPLMDKRSDLVLVLRNAGLQTLGNWVVAQLAASPPPAEVADGGQGNAGRLVPVQAEPRYDDSWRAVGQSLLAIFADAPELKRLAMESRGVGCGLTLDNEGNAIVKVRAQLSPGAQMQFGTEHPRPLTAITAPMIYDGGPFIFDGSARVSGNWLLPLVAPYVKQMSDDLATQYSAKVDDAELAKFRAEVEAAVAQVRAASVLTRPGSEPDGVYTNSFLSVQVASADDFLKQVEAAVDQWNSMLATTDSAAALAFEQSPTSIDGHEGTECSIDMSKAVGAPPLPETRQSMERLFGPGGRFRLQFIKVDEKTVLLAMATQDQLTVLLGAMITHNSTARHVEERSRPTAQLLSGDSDWRCYLSLDGYNHWLKRQMDAIVGPVIGGPIVRPFPEVPPIGAVGGMTDDTAWAEFAVPADTLRAIGQFVHP